jgi:antirestriction protein
MNNVRLYIADLGAYNAGRLRGEWITVGAEDTGDDIRSAIEILLRKWDAEEYAIHDYEGIPRALYSEHPDLDAIAAYAELLERFDEDVVEAYFELPYWREVDPAQWGYDIESRFHGRYLDRGEWAAHHRGAAGQVPTHIERYVDYDAMARDAEYNGEVDFVDVGTEIAVFSAF